MVKLLAVPENLYVARVWTDQVPAVRRPPVVLAWIVPRVGRPEPPVGELPRCTTARECLSSCYTPSTSAFCTGR